MKYKRLQVGPVWLRTLIEIVLILTAFVICSTLVVSYYENSYYEATQAQAAESNAQLAYSLAPSVDLELLNVEDADRAEYVRKNYYDPLLNSFFVSGDVLNSGAIYTVSDGSVELYAASEYYPSALSDEAADALNTCISKGFISLSTQKVNFSFVPVEDELGNVRAILAVSSEYRDSLDYNSIVSSRMRTIAIVCGGIIIIYYVVSGIITTKNKRKEAQVG